jgi:hypothetical protein
MITNLRSFRLLGSFGIVQIIWRLEVNGQDKEIWKENIEKEQKKRRGGAELLRTPAWEQREQERSASKPSEFQTHA